MDKNMKELHEFKNTDFGGRYLVDSSGGVYSFYRTGIKSFEFRMNPVKLKGSIVDGYLKHFLSDIYGNKISIFAHQLVLHLFVEPQPAGMVARHLDGNRTNNNVENLKWGTFKENYQDMLDHNNQNYCRGSEHPSSKIDESDVVSIRKMYADGIKMRKISRELNIGYFTVWDVAKNRTWKHVRIGETI